MLTLRQAGRLLLLMFMLGLWFAMAGCAGPQAIGPSEIASSFDPIPSPAIASAPVPHDYAPPADWRGYNRAILDPVAIYRGSDQQFGNMAEADKVSLAGYMRLQFAEKLRSRFTLVSNPGPNTLRVRLTLTGAETNRPLSNALSNLDVTGAANAASEATSRAAPGAMTGSVSYVVEILDATTARLLSVFVTKQYPGPYKLGAMLDRCAIPGTAISNG